MKKPKEQSSNGMSLIDRDCLNTAVKGIQRFPVTLIEAPAGYGKTSLLVLLEKYFKESNAYIRQIGTARVINNPISIIQQIITVLPVTEDAQTSPLLPVPFSPAQGEQVQLLKLMNQLAEIQNTTYLIFDDVDHLDTSASELLEHIIASSPPTIHWILSARGQGNNHWARLKVYGSLYTITWVDLACSHGEIQALANNLGVNILDDTLDILLADFGGWLPGIRLALSDIANGNPCCDTANKALHRFFEEEVFNSWHPSFRPLITQLAILEEITPDVAAVLVADFNSELLREAEKKGYFLFETTDENNEKWQLHPVFRRFLADWFKRKKPEQFVNLHIDASQWYSANGNGVKAVYHAAESTDAKLLAEKLEQHCEALNHAGVTWRIGEYAAAIAPEILAKMPATLMYLAWLKIRSLCFTEARALLLSVEQYTSKKESDNAKAGFSQQLFLQLKHSRVMLAYAEDELAEVGATAGELLTSIDSDFLKCTLYEPIMAVERERLNYDDFDQLRLTASNLANKLNCQSLHIAQDTIVGPTLMELGRTEKADEVLSAALKLSIKLSGASSGAAAAPALPLARLRYETNNLASSQLLIDTYLPLASKFTLTDQLIDGYITHARLKIAAGNSEAAHTILDEGLAQVPGSGFSRFKVALIAERIKILIDENRLKQAEYQRLKIGISHLPDSVIPGVDISSFDQNNATVWVRLAIAQNNAGVALSVARHWRKICGQRNAVKSELHWELIIVRCHLAMDNINDAQRALRKAVALAAKGGFVRSLLDEGPQVRSLLTMTFSNFDASGSVDSFVKNICNDKDSLLIQTQPEYKAGLHLSSITVRETEILHLAGDGLKNKEIGSRLGLTEGTVKWYFRQIYDKLGTRRRGQAIDLARSFGLLSR
ncbi:MAG: LuxR C-terminal-related transcriptional regulator [Spongiibacteraceae bacterium]